MLNGQAGPYRDLLEAAGLAIRYPPPGVDTLVRENLLPLLEGAEAMIASTEALSEEVLSQSSLRVVARMGVGYDSVDVAAATRLGIAVTITPGTVEDSAAEHTLALMLGVSRGLLARDREVRQGQWRRQAMPRLAGKLLGLIGLGRIGGRVARLVQGIGMRVAAHDPFADAAAAAERDIELVSLQELLAAADVVSLHLPCTAQTENLINQATLAAMKPGAILVNTSRGGLVDEDAVVAALREGRLLGAALDVFKSEPLPIDSPLVGLDNVLLCTHMAGLDEQSQRDSARLAAQCVVELHEGRWPEGCVVNREIRDGWKW